MQTQHSLTQHFLQHQRLWASTLLISWLSLNILINSTNVLMETQRNGGDIAFWQPLSWEISSSILLFALFPLVVRFIDKLTGLAWQQQVLFHILATIPFSLVHVIGMVLLRKLVYWSLDSEYIFGDWQRELLYEYRKDAQSYIAFLIVIYVFRFIVLRLQGEASYLSEDEGSQEQNTEANNENKSKRDDAQAKNPLHSERLLVKKFGKEFLIRISDIEWVEAAGNYVNLHLGQRVYPMRSTMAKLEDSLPSQQFARIHRSYFVNLDFVQEMESLDAGDYRVTLRNGKVLNMSRRYREAFKENV